MNVYPRSAVGLSLDNARVLLCCTQFARQLATGIWLWLNDRLTRLECWNGVKLQCGMTRV